MGMCAEAALLLGKQVKASSVEVAVKAAVGV